jgi:hypothetical protein
MKKVILALVLVGWCGVVGAVDYTQNADCILALTMEEGSGNTADKSSNTLTGVLYNGASWLTSSPPDAYSTKYINTPSTSTIDFIGISGTDVADKLDATNITITAWIYRTTDTGTYESLVWRDNNNSAKRVFQFRIETDDKLGFLYFTTGSTNYSGTSSGTIPTGTWTHIAVTYNGDVITLYINGSPTTVDTTNGNISTLNAAISIGYAITYDTLSTTFSAFPFKGSFDEVSIFKTALTQSEIPDVYDNGLSPTTTTTRTIGWTIY